MTNAVLDTVSSLLAVLEPEDIKDVAREVGVRIEINALQAGDKIHISNEKQRKEFERLIRAKMRQNEERTMKEKHFLASFHQEDDSVFKELELKELGLLFHLVLHANLKSAGLLMKDENNVLQQKHIMEETGLSDKTLKARLDRLIDKKVILEENMTIETRAKKNSKAKGIRKGNVIKTWVKAYRLNEKYHWMGRFNDEMRKQHFTKIYKIETRTATENLQIETKGFLCLLVNKLHYQTNFISKKPSEDLRTDYDHTFEYNSKNGILKENCNMNMNDIIEFSGKSKAAVARYLTELDESNIIRKMGRGKKAVFVINPWLFRRVDPDTQTDVYTFLDGVAELFNQSK